MSAEPIEHDTTVNPQALAKSSGGYYGSGQVSTADYTGGVGGALATLSEEDKSARNKAIEQSCSGYNPDLQTGPLHENVLTGNASGNAVANDEDEEEDEDK